MAAPAALVISKIVYPETEPSETKGTVKLEVTKAHSNLLEAISHGCSEGLRIGLNVIAMLLGFIALIALADYILGSIGNLLVSAGVDLTGIGINIGNLSMKSILGALFAGFAWAMGVPSQDVFTAGSLMGTKMVLNEFVAYLDLTALKEQMHPKSFLIASFALCGFANFSSIAIQIGGIGELAPTRRTDLAKLGFRALICGTLASYLSATLAGLLMSF